MHQCSKNAKLGKIVELGGEATCSIIKNVITGKVRKKHALHLRKASLGAERLEQPYPEF